VTKAAVWTMLLIASLAFWAAVIALAVWWWR